MDGACYYEAVHFAMKYPRLAWAVNIPLACPLSLNHYQGNGPIPIWPTFIRWITGGRWPARDCVCVVVDALAASGIHAPQSIVTPANLWDWLRSEGHEFIEL